MLIKVTPDKEKVKSILKLIENREKFVFSVDIGEFSTIAVENYYEIIKELAASLLLLDGLTATGEGAHAVLIKYLSTYDELSAEETSLMDDLRIKRNKSSYEGKKIDKSYLQNKRDKLLVIINKLKNLLNKKL